MLELQNESELMAAQMEKEAMVSVNICEQAICEEKEQELDNIEEINANQIQRVYESAPIQAPRKGMLGFLQLSINVNQDQSKDVNYTRTPSIRMN